MERADRKRSFEHMEYSSADIYEFSESEKASLREAADYASKFKGLHDLDIPTKISALKTSPSVVALISFSGESVLREACGTIIETCGNVNTVFTSLNLIRDPINRHLPARYVRNNLADNLKVVICSSDKKTYLAQIFCYDLHYNLLVVKFKSSCEFPSATQALIRDTISNDSPFMMRPHSTSVKPGDHVIAVGRYFSDDYECMVVPGTFSMKHADITFYDCLELLTTTCYITKCSDGAPVINASGEVFGIAYYHQGGSSPILPMIVANTWWKHYKQYNEMRHLSYGFQGGHLYSAMFPFLESFSANFARINDGVYVADVTNESFAESAGLLPDDVIIKCDGKSVKSFLELWGLMWDKVGEVVELQVARLGLDAIQIIRMTVGEAEELNKWPEFHY